ncbi:YfjI family protein [uncultured Endozoicomonas sp.]|uniref:YfjI family protein n=1 Tax=uncultured Endozoicomonas sp. TaxID=432652 RepID=UPI0026390809|nr:YfjI family protein [uncultured Endozoicomonas sp.]
MALCDSNKVTLIEPDAENKTEGAKRQFDWPELKPLNDKLLPVQPITLDMLPSELSGWLTDITERMDNVAFEYVAVAAVTVSSSLIGRKVTVKPKHNDDWVVVANLWGCCIGRPSEKKSPAINAVTKPLKRLEENARELYENDRKRYEVQDKITQMANKDAEKRASKLVNEGKHHDAVALLMDDSSDPEKPTCHRYIVHDSTIEKLGVILSENPNGVLQLRDELSGWIAGLNRDDRQQDRAFWLEAFNGDGAFSYDRISREDVYIKSNTVSILGGIQPGRLLPLLINQREGSGDDGLIERFQLLVYPDSAPFKHTDRAPDKLLQKKAYAVFKRLDDIEYKTEEDERPSLHFGSEGQAVFDQWYCQLMMRIRSGHLSQSMESHLGKYPSLMSSLALIFHIIQNGATGSIGKESALMAIRWCEVLESHAARVYGLINDAMASARILIHRLNKLPRAFKMKDLENKRWTGLQEKHQREQALKVLETHGYVIRDEQPGNGRPSVTYYINPACLKDTEE